MIHADWLAAYAFKVTNSRCIARKYKMKQFLRLDLTCDVIGDNADNFHNHIWEFMYLQGYPMAMKLLKSVW